jgi:phosphatidate cytidylyltransferase
MFIQRALITFTLGPLALYLIYLGGWFYFLPVAAILLLGVIEYSHLMRRLGWSAPIWLLAPTCVGLWVVMPESWSQLFGGPMPSAHWAEAALLLSLLVAMGYALWLYERRSHEPAAVNWLATMSGILLLGWLGSHFFRLRGVGEMAWEWTAMAMLGTWVADSGAYVFGKTMGRRKLAPRLSPNKTIEGYVGGIITGVLATVLVGRALALPLGGLIALGLLVSVVSPAGDLGESLLKRSAGVKDSGTLFPGHGGALDRIDSLIWSVAMAYYLVLWIR